MKSLIIISISLFTLNLMATGTNHNCAAQAQNDRNNAICNNSLLSPETRITKFNCPSAQVIQDQQTEGADRSTGS